MNAFPSYFFLFSLFVQHRKLSQERVTARVSTGGRSVRMACDQQPHRKRIILRLPADFVFLMPFLFPFLSGIFIYEMLASYPPFYDEDPMKTYAKIMQGTINFPSHFSKEAVSIIKKLLQHKPTKRLGVVNGGAAEISQRTTHTSHAQGAGRQTVRIFHRTHVHISCFVVLVCPCFPQRTILGSSPWIGTC